MIRRILHIVLLSVGVAFIMNSCKSTKGVTEQKELTAQQKLEQILQGYGEWDTVSASGKISVDAVSSSVRIQMVRGESISLSIRPMLGIEVAKILLRSDSIYVMDKMNRRYLCKRIAEVSEKLNFNITSVQDMVMNRIFLPNREIRVAKKEFKVTESNSSYWSAITKNSNDRLSYDFIFNDMNLVEMNIKSVDLPELFSFSVKYSGFEDTGCGVVASAVSPSVKAGNKRVGANININASSIVYDKEIKEDFKISSNYTEMSISSLLNLLKKAL